MPVALLLFLPLLTSLANSLAKGADNAASGKYNRLFVWLLAGFGVYLLVKGWGTSKQQTYLNTAGTDLATQQAQALRDAFNRSGIELMMQVDGTDVDLVMSTAAQIKDYAAVSDSYRVLYKGSELTTDLQKELSRTDLQKFWDIVYKRGSNPTTPSTGTGTTTSGKRVRALQTVNVREYDNPATIHHQAVKGDVLGNFIGEATLTVTGKSERFIIVETDSFFGLWTSRYYVHKPSVALF